MLSIAKRSVTLQRQDEENNRLTRLQEIATSVLVQRLDRAQNSKRIRHRAIMSLKYSQRQ
jgi:hypothetical protein